MLYEPQNISVFVTQFRGTCRHGNLHEGGGAQRRSLEVEEVRSGAKAFLTAFDRWKINLFRYLSQLLGRY